MNADRLIALFERVANAPDAISRLRSFVLDLAVRGKLAEQVSADVSAAKLLDDIGLARKRLGLKSSGMSPEIGETPFSLPSGWGLTRLGDICTKTGSGSTPRGGKDVYKETGIPFLRSQNIHNAGLRLDDVVYIDPQTHDKMKATSVVAGDLLLNITGGSIGRCTRVPSGFTGANISQHVAIIRPAVEGLDAFLHHLILSPYFQAFIFDEQTGAGRGGLPKNRMDQIVVALPPLAEQRRIVAKVDELVALLDRLAATRQQREATRDRLAVATLTRLTAPDTPAEDAITHARFALNTLPALATRPDQITVLRQTILNLAVRGKLVPQDTTDEPAAELLNRLHSGRRHKRKVAELNRDKLENNLEDLPKGWLWTVVDQIAADDARAITDGPFGSQLKTSHYVTKPGYRVIRLQNIAPGIFREEHRSYIDEARYNSLANHHIKPGDLVVAGLVDPNIRCCEVPPDLGPTLVKADCYRLAVHPEISRQYVLHYLNSPVAQDFALTHHHGMTLTRIGLGNFRTLPISLPPLAEQHRIVAKVEALMALCDQLEAALTTANTTRSRLLEALLHEALAPAGILLEAAA